MPQLWGKQSPLDEAFRFVVKAEPAVRDGKTMNDGGYDTLAQQPGETFIRLSPAVSRIRLVSCKDFVPAISAQGDRNALTGEAGEVEDR